jgi:hypothetical protein
MNLHKKRLVRTPSSEEYALFDLDRTDANLDPVSLGKLDLHFSADGTYGTLLLWKEAFIGLNPTRREILIDTLLAELTSTMGIHADYALELFVPELSSYELHSNIVDESLVDEGDSAEGQDTAAEDEPTPDELEDKSYE